jgi:hypothetical protein
VFAVPLCADTGCQREHALAPAGDLCAILLPALTSRFVAGVTAHSRLQAEAPEIKREYDKAEKLIPKFLPFDARSPVMVSPRRRTASQRNIPTKAELAARQKSGVGPSRPGS